MKLATNKQLGATDEAELMRYKLALIALLGLTSASSAQVRATKEQGISIETISIINLYVLMSHASIYCPEMKVNVDEVKALGRSEGLPSDAFSPDGPYKQVLAQRNKTLKSSFVSHRVETCEVAIDKFGGNIKGREFIRRKRPSE